MSEKGWFGVDLDGTLVHYDHGDWKGPLHLGLPVPAMLERVKLWLTQGERVKIFTARVSDPDPEKNEAIRKAVQDWCEVHGLPRLEVTNVKDFAMLELWDDRAVQVEANTGRRVGYSTRGKE